MILTVTQGMAAAAILGGVGSLSADARLPIVGVAQSIAGRFAGQGGMIVDLMIVRPVKPVPAPGYDYPIGHSLKSDYGVRGRGGRLIIGRR
jgi:hypothetical protein